MPEPSMYSVRCICGETIISKKLTGTCKACGRLFELHREWDGKEIKNGESHKEDSKT